MPGTPIDLKSRLTSACQAWAVANDAPLSRVAKQVIGSANFFDRLADGAGCTTTTLEKFAAFLADAANWPEGVVPEEAVEFAHRVGIVAHPADMSPGNSGSPSRAPAAGGAR